jgi:pyruvate dehydrogenase E1 component
MSALPSNPPANAAAFDTDAQETREWLEALDAVIAPRAGARPLPAGKADRGSAPGNGIDRPFSANTAYVNTIEPVDEERSPGNLEIEGGCAPTCAGTRWRWWSRPTGTPGGRRRPGRPHQLVRSRWRTCSPPASTTSGMPRAEGRHHGGDLLYIQGHSAPGIYARAFMEGR